MSDVIHELSQVELARLMAGEPRVLAFLAAGESVLAKTPFLYPGRRGPVVVHLTPGAGPPPPQAAGGTEAVDASERPVRISDGGDLILSLDEQGMDLAIDMIVSKTVFHAVKETEGGVVVNGQICLDSTVGKVPADLWRFLQLVAEIIGLRHSKYKDALLRLSRRDGDPDLIQWEDQRR